MYDKYHETNGFLNQRVILDFNLMLKSVELAWLNMYFCIKYST